MPVIWAHRSKGDQIRFGSCKAVRKVNIVFLLLRCWVADKHSFSDMLHWSYHKLAIKLLHMSQEEQKARLQLNFNIIKQCDLVLFACAFPHLYDCISHLLKRTEEFGRHRILLLLIKSCSAEQIIFPHPQVTVNHSTTTRCRFC